MSTITKKKASLALLIVAFATSLVIGPIVLSADNSVFASRSSHGHGHHHGNGHGHGHNSDGNSVDLKSKQKQTALCQSAGGNSPITASCINAQSHSNTNSGGIASASGSGDSNGNSIGLKNNQKQRVVCQSAGGNSPFTLSCINAQTSANDNSGGIASASGSGDSNGNSIGLKNNQKQTALCQSAGGNSAITASCINAQAAGQTNSGGIATS